MITSARPTTRPARRLRSSLLAPLLAACAVVAPAIAGGGLGTAHADTNGYTAVCPGMLLKVGQASAGSCWGTTILAQTAFQASESLAGTPNPSVDWGDGTVNTLATPPSQYADRPSNCDQPGSEGAFGPFPGFGPVTCRLFDQHTYTAPGIYTVAITYYTGFAIHYTATTRAVVSDGGSAPIGRYFAPGVGHWVTTGYASPEYQLETVLGYALTSMDANTLPLYDCLAGASDHFVSLDAGCEGQQGGRAWAMSTAILPPTRPAMRSTAATPVSSISSPSTPAARGSRPRSGSATRCRSRPARPSEHQASTGRSERGHHRALGQACSAQPVPSRAAFASVGGLQDPVRKIERLT